MPRFIALLAVLVNLLAGALPAGSIVHVGRDGRVAIEAPGCCAMDVQGPDLALVHGQSRPVHCCCFTGVVVGHADVHPGLATGCELPALPPEDAWWAFGLFEHALDAMPGSVVQSHARPPPPLGALRPDTIVIRC